MVGAALAALLVVSTTAAALLLVRPPFPLAAERLCQAMAFRLVAPMRPPHPGIALIGISEETLSAFPYRSPWTAPSWRLCQRFRQS